MARPLMQLPKAARNAPHRRLFESHAVAGGGIVVGVVAQEKHPRITRGYTPPLDGPLVFRRGEGGALSYVHARSKAEIDDQATLTALLKADDWIMREAWEKAADEQADLSRDRARAARQRLIRSGKVVEVELRDGKRFKKLFAPAESAGRPIAWPGAAYHARRGRGPRGVSAPAARGNAAVFLAGPPTHVSLSSLVEEALRRELVRLEKAHRSGKPFPQRSVDLRGRKPRGR